MAECVYEEPYGLSFQAIFTFKAGWSVILTLFNILWKALEFWQVADFLPSRMTPLGDFLNSLESTLVLVGLGFLLVGKAVYDRWPESPRPEPQGLSVLSDENLRQRCCELPNALFEFHRRQQETKDVALQSDYMTSLYNDPQETRNARHKPHAMIRG
jgi:hypothetical protein